MGTTVSSCKECFGPNSKGVLSAKSSLNYQQCKRKKSKTREPSDDDLEKPELPLTKEDILSADDAADRQDSDDEKSQSLSIDDFKIIRELGRGSFGKVYLVQKKSNKKYYALKAMNKQDLILKNLLKLVLNEKQILKELKHPFVVQLRYCFQCESRVYMVMDYCPGGDLSHWMKGHGKLSEKIVKVYAAEMVLALEYLHETLNVIHRDIKPENILIASDGHIKITDFGLAKTTTQTMTLCGTPDFLAPEIILGKPYGQVVDWWSLGCLMYEMLTGHSTFAPGNPDKLIFSIVKENPKMEASFSEPLKDILTKFLEKSPKKRLGYRGAEEVKKHPFFKDINWEALAKKEIPPPFGKAALKLSADSSLLEEDKDGSIFEIPPEEPTQKTPHDANYYSQFSFVARDTASEIPSDIYTK